MNDPENKDKVGTAIVGKAACGDVIKLQVRQTCHSDVVTPEFVRFGGA